jgi:glycosyltransferase involved in cell wall biosynthesis
VKLDSGLKDILMKGSLIIPAHNEASVISKALAPLAKSVDAELIDVIVVCNGCNDDTADVVRRDFPEDICLETDIPSKSNALNLGEQVATHFPRIYMDADVVLKWDALQLIVEVLESGNVLAAAPRFSMDFTAVSWMVKAYYGIWQRLPYVKEGMIGAGVYALSETGRQRFDKFPDVIADDGYVRALFKSHERTVVDNCEVTVRAPRTLADLLKIKTRSRLGVYQLHREFPELLGNEEKQYGSALKRLLPQIWLWPKLAVYLWVNLVARRRAKKQLADLKNVSWERDESRRVELT